MANRKTHEKFIQEFTQQGNHNVIILGKYVNQKTKILVKCLLDGHEWLANPCDLLRGRGCPVCAGLKIMQGVNDFATLRQDLLIYFINPCDATKITIKSNKDVYLKCPDCGQLKTMTANNLSTRGFSCPVCGQHISYPNRLIRSIMSQLKVDYLQYEWSQKWTNKQKYDVYFEVNKCKYTIEMQGEQHYGGGWNRNIPIEELESYDSKKEKRAIEHGIIPITIDAHISDFNFIFHNIKNSLLSTVFDLSILDIEKCKHDSLKNIIKEVCAEYSSNHNMLLEDLAKKYMVNRNTISNYLIQGSKIGWCDYDPTLSWQRFKNKVSTPVNVLNVDCIVIGHHESVQECARDSFDMYGTILSATSISRAAKSGKPYKNLYFQYT